MYRNFWIWRKMAKSGGAIFLKRNIFTGKSYKPMENL